MHNRWVYVMNTRLVVDSLSTNAKKFGLKAVEQTRGQRQTGRNDLPDRVRGCLMDGESRKQEVLDHIHTPNVVYIQT